MAAADRPVDRTGTDSKHRLDLVHQFKRIPGFPVHLVDKGKYGDVAHDTDLEQLDRLRLNTLGTVYDHDRGIRRHKGPVCVLREILMPRGIQDINAVSVVIELHYRGGNGNTSLLLDLHPV